MYRSVYFFLLSVIIVACNKNSGTSADRQAPVIAISSPAAGQVFAGGQSITIAGTISDDNYIAEVHIHVTNSVTGALLMDVHLYPAAASASFLQNFNVVSGTNYRITVTAKDRAVNEGRSSTDVSAN